MKKHLTLSIEKETKKQLKVMAAKQSTTVSELVSRLANANESDFIQLDAVVFPGDKKTIKVQQDETYKGAHFYLIQNSVGFVKDQQSFTDSYTAIKFLQKDESGVTPGILNEQLYHVLIDRIQKLNSRFPSAENDLQVELLQKCLKACEKRLKERIKRGVMGELKK